MIDAATQALVLQRYPMLRELPAAQLAELLTDAALLRMPAGSLMFDENQPCRGLPLLLSGSVRIVKAAPNGRALHLYQVRPGDSCILTSSCLLGHAPYHARGTAECDIELVVLPPAAFKRLMAQLESFREHVFSNFSQRLTDLMALVSAVAFQKLDQRLAALLVARESPLHTTHQALADELGSVREIVSRLLKNFADQGWLRLGREQIEVLDAAALARFVSL
ncbi:Crp/Fnr family transcriptional regulator [Rhizobacter sp. OV335]|uniref:Crp/Fnr family transcriptional regulator n=1 Tax=Rhizobacter sp. OV335 TaxID=1500264 RepID=UPI0009120751|nr:Crp/Fnr family transcriptional regulator [Rhizobacter sp. OV335]SHN16062.1 CRP/FNR family transcriptional regulator, anaerobic regulatory protein [Rhizobacter sp. OV335]